MSWVKRRSTTNSTVNTVNPAPPVQMYNPNQQQPQQQTRPDNQWNMPPPMQNQQSWYDQNQQSRNQQPQQPFDYNQQTQQQFWPQNYNQQQQQPAYNQNNDYQQYQNRGYQQQRQLYQQDTRNMYSQQQQQQQSLTNTENDTWNWEWGDEDNSNTKPQQAANSNFNSVIDSFSNDSTWGWSLEDTKSTSSLNAVNEINALETQESVANVKTAENVPLDRLTVNQRVKADNLTPQWSVESQMSQDSSDDILQTSGSDKSHMLSRSSTVSQSSASTHDLALGFQDNYIQPQAANKEDLNSQQNLETPIPKPELQSKLDLPLKTTPPPPSASDQPNQSFKRIGAHGHRSTSTSTSRFEPSFRSAYGFNQLNLETLPDNSEQPDFPGHHQQQQQARKNPRPENVELAAPMNDRNQYLETGQLSEFNQVVERGQGVSEGVDTLPPPGLRRMVLGQMEQIESGGGENRSNDSFGEEPPPGLSRMVLGQPENTTSPTPAQQQEAQEPPIGFHRMIPGESSSPETIQQRQQTYLQPSLNYSSEPEAPTQPSPQMRSATIGADTPPSAPTAYSPPLPLNRSETLLLRSTTSLNSEGRIGALGLDSLVREGDVDGGNVLDEEGDTNRRESIEGQPEDSDIGNLVTSVRDMIVGENPTDSTPSTGNLLEPIRRHSRQESSESDRDRREMSPRDRKDRKYRSGGKGGKGREGDRYTPDNYQKDRKNEKYRYRDRRYEEDTDYYSDKERERRVREDYDRKYNSLRRDKERDRRRRDYGDYRERDRKREYYYGRYEEDYDNDTRPSSRSDSLHENYKERGHERYTDRDRQRDRHHRRHREPFNNYMQMYGYDPYSPYYQQYQYYENLRRTNPQAYAEWYRKYYQQTSTQMGPFGAEDRSSVHSGRSSANDELAKDRYVRYYNQQASLPHVGGYYRDTHSVSSQYGFDVSSYSRPYDQTDNNTSRDDTLSVSQQRMTPAKFPTAHVKVSIASGNMIKVVPSYPGDGQPAVVEMGSLHGYFANDDDYKELARFPGPLIKGVTHKKQIIEYCEGKIRTALQCGDFVDCQSYVLMWELLILLIRQNGMVVGADIAELLMKERRSEESARRPSSVLSNVSSNPDALLGDGSYQVNSELVHSSSSSVLKEEVVTNKFREYLIYGSGKEALEWAMKHGLWGHALFLASKLDKRTYANVMMRFANGLTMNDPLQTLYQLLSGRLPAAVTCVADEKWGDWKPHLAMILSNTSQHPELDRRAITTLADTLLARGSLYAAHFCYLMAQVEFGKYGDETAKLVLLGSDQTQSFIKFATNEAIHMTEIYEYACNLNDGSFVLEELQTYKYLLATRLADSGFLEKALGYLERISNILIQNPKIARPSLVKDVFKLADRLKYYDPAENHGVSSYDNDLDTTRPDNSWLKELKDLLAEQTGLRASGYESTASRQEQVLAAEGGGGYEQDAWQQQVQYEQQQQQQQFQDSNMQQWQQEQYGHQIGYQHEEQPQSVPLQQIDQQQQQFWINQQQQQQQQWTPNVETTVADQYNQQQPTQQNDYWNDAQNEREEVEKAPSEDAPRPQISMPNQSKGKSDAGKEDPATAVPPKTSKPAQPSAVQDKSSTTGWFGGIWSKLALRPKNQMKLPDDKNPTIVWDPEKKRWVNLEAEGSDEVNEVKPPPKMSDIVQKMKPISQENAALNNNVLVDPNVGLGKPNPPRMQQQTVTNYQNQPAEDPGLPPKPTQPNMFKLQKTRNLKKSYVDIFNPGGKTSNSGPTFAPDNYPSMPAQNVNYFVPQPVNNANTPTDFLTPTGPVQADDGASQMSRWSSTSSLSKEVQYYMRQKPIAPH